MHRLLTLAILLSVLPTGVHADYIEGTFVIQGGFFPISTPVTGDIDTTAQTITIDPAQIWGAPYTTLIAEYLVPGTYTRSYTPASGPVLTRSATIPAGTVGAYFVVSINGESYQLYNAWTISGDGLTFTNQAIAGDVWIGGNYNGRRAIYEFSITDPPPPPPAELLVTITLNNGASYQCSETGGHKVNGINATVVEEGNAVLDYVQWDLDGTILGQGLSNTEFAPAGIFVPLGSYTLTATAFALDGNSNSASRTLTVNDTVAPTLDVQFLDQLGNQITVANAGSYQVHYETSDICDDNVDVVGTATPVMQVFEGDSIDVISGNEVNLPTTAIRVNAVATDDSGRSNSQIGVLQIQ